MLIEPYWYEKVNTLRDWVLENLYMTIFISYIRIPSFNCLFTKFFKISVVLFKVDYHRGKSIHVHKLDRELNLRPHTFSSFWNRREINLYSCWMMLTGNASSI